MPKGLSRRRWLGLGAAASALGVAGIPVGHLGTTWWTDGEGEPPVGEGHADDAGHFDGAAVERIAIHGGPDQAIEEVRAALLRARSEGRPISVAGARHTMGGHTIAPGGLQLDLAGVDGAALRDRSLVIGGGARWSDVVPFLDARGRAVRVMQSNADFSIGGSLGANCHGWQPGCAPIASTVQAFTCVLADGTALRCSRAENTEVFRHLLGGYGLIGVVVEAELDTTANVEVASERRVISLDALGEVLPAAADAELAFARLSIPEGDDRFEEVLLTTYARTPGEPAAMTPTPEDDVARLVFRGGIESPLGKSLRWALERELGSEGGVRCSRNQLMCEPVARFGNRRPDRVDVLFEGFVPPSAVAAYARDVRSIVAEHGVDLLNVTARHVREDVDSVLRYAAGERIGLVMLFHHARTRAADERMAAASRDLIDATFEHGGRHYLPYRGHATRAQLERAYPEAAAFAAFKRSVDPDGMFQNRFFHRYLA